MNVTEAIQSRRSIRKFEGPEQMPEEHIKTILTAAMMAPSARNTRPWEFVVLQSRQAKEKALMVHPYAKHLKDAAIGILVCAKPDLQEGVADGYFPQDCGAAVENMLLQALELGYGSCWCGIYPREERVSLFRETFQLKSVPVGLVVIGKSAEHPAAKGFYDEERVTFL